MCATRKRTAKLQSTSLRCRSASEAKRRRRGRLLLERLEPRQMLNAGPLAISEFMADNGAVLADGDGFFSDWIEIHNPTGQTVVLDGWHLTDDANNLTKWSFPDTNPDTTLGPDEYLVVFASNGRENVVPAPGDPNVDGDGNLHASFRLDADGDYLGLVRANGVTVSDDFGEAFAKQYGNFSYGPTQDLSEYVSQGDDAKFLVPTAGDAGDNWTATGYNDSAWTGSSAPVATGLGFDRNPSGGSGQFEVEFYKANVRVDSLSVAQDVLDDPAKQTYVQAAAAEVINYFNTGGQGNYAPNNTFPSLTIGADVEDFVVRATTTVVIPSPGYWTFGVNSDDGFGLTLTNGTDTFSTSHPNPRGPGDTLGAFNFQQAGAYDLELVYYERGGGAGVELFAAPGSHTVFNPADFDLVGDVANGGLALGGIAGLIRTNVEDVMYDVNSTLWVRVPFVLEEAPGTLGEMTLRMMYDDGFVAYLNGTPIASDNAPGSLAWNSSALIAKATEDFVEFDVTAHQGLLQAGTNVLAIHAMNVAANDDSFLVLPELVAAEQGEVLRYFKESTPGAENGPGYIGFVKDTSFSHDRGFYTAPFDVTVTTNTPLAEIYYTTDGSEPSETAGVKVTGPIHVDETTVLRATAFKDGYYPTNVDTQTYLFLADVVEQDGTPPAGWPTGSVNGQVLRYGMSSAIVDSPTWGPQMEGSLKAIPTMSLVTDVDNLFGQANGIYVNPRNDGLSWERPASLELIYPEDTSADPDGFPDGIDGGFQVEAGVRIRGGYSRNPSNPKHAFRLFFREQYGDAKLNYPLFGDEGDDSFDKIDLRTTQNYSWAWNNDSANTFLRDAFNRDSQGKMGQPYTRSRFYHLYINGQYWGIFQTQERSEAAYAEQYFGGDRDDYDVVKHYGNGIYVNNMTDGNWNAFTALYNAAMAGFSGDAYYIAQGLDPVTHERDPALDRMVDVDNVIDYMISVFHAGDRDAPISNFIGNSAVNNYFGIYNRENPDGWKWFRHDGEHTYDRGMEDRTGPWTHSNFNSRDYFNPQILHQKLVAHPDYRMRFADRVHKHFHNGGVLDGPTTQATIQERADQIDTAIIAHSARWGNGKTKNTWLGAVSNFKNWAYNGTGTSGVRTDEVLAQLRSDGWYPSVNPPTFSTFGGPVTAPFALTLGNPNGTGTLYYTDDGTDPRLPGGAIAPTAKVYSSAVAINQSRLVKARVRSSGGVWSAVTEAQFFTAELAAPDNLVVTEINYHAHDPLPEELATQAPGDTPFEDNDFEFVELINLTTDTLVDLTGVAFVDGIEFAFDDGGVHVLAPQQRVVVVKNEAAFEARYGTGHNVAGSYGDENLSNGGEDLRLDGALGQIIFNFAYNDANEWPGRPDGKGATLVLSDPTAVPTDNAQLRTDYLQDGDNWHSSVGIGGTPGAEPQGELGIVINEVLSHTDFPQFDSIELHNTSTTEAVNVGGWYLSDSWGWDPLVADGNNENYKKYRIRTDAPGETTIPAGGYLLFDERDFNPMPGTPLLNHFALDGAHGDHVWLMASDRNDPTGELTHFGDHVEFGAQANAESWGRWPDGTGGLYPINTSTLDAENTSGPRLGDVIISELHYNPGTMFNADELEFVEIYNTTGVAQDLTNWRIRKGIEYDFAAGTSLDVFATLVIVPFDPVLQSDRLANFLDAYAPAGPIDVVGPYDRQLEDGGERVQLQYPDLPPSGEPDFYPGLLEDEVIYDDEAGWPLAADGAGASLHRTATNVWGNVPASWTALDPSPGSVTFQTPSTEVVGRWVFYNESGFDGGLAEANEDDDQAVATDKTALLPGGAATA
ncbi:MAG: lamin tail domain-containing protein, partial [Candidatus Nealsonbacteria bacterium]|nr:lamin tail domain-containing protein [Candidatus Nealsonbacteria bacterium]